MVGAGGSSSAALLWGVCMEALTPSILPWILKAQFSRLPWKSCSMGWMFVGVEERGGSGLPRGPHVPKFRNGFQNSGMDYKHYNLNWIIIKDL